MNKAKLSTLAMFSLLASHVFADEIEHVETTGTRLPSPLPSMVDIGSGGGAYTDPGENSGVSGGNSNSSSDNSSDKKPKKKPKKSEREICLERVAISYSICKFDAADSYEATLNSSCIGKATASFNFGTPIFTGGLSVDEYNQCKDRATAYRDRELRGCDVGNEIKKSDCP